MKKMFIAKHSESLADGRVVFPGGIVDLPAAKWAENAHLAEKFIDAEEAKPEAPASKQSKSNKE